MEFLLVALAGGLLGFGISFASLWLAYSVRLIDSFNPTAANSTHFLQVHVPLHGYCV